MYTLRDVHTEELTKEQRVEKQTLEERRWEIEDAGEHTPGNRNTKRTGTPKNKDTEKQRNSDTKKQRNRDTVERKRQRLTKN